MIRLDIDAEQEISRKAFAAYKRDAIGDQSTYNWTVSDRDLNRYKVRVVVRPVDAQTLDIDYEVTSPASEKMGRRFTYQEF